MSIPAVDRIAEIQRKADEEIQALRQHAVTEVVKRLSEMKAEIRALEGQYAQLTGKSFPTEAAHSGTNGAKTERKRLSTEEKAALIETVRGILAADPSGVSMGELVRTAGQSVGAVREAVSKVQTKTTGARAGTRYFLP